MSGIFAAMSGRAAGVSITDRIVTKGGNATTTVTASYALNSDGTVRNQNSTLLETWLQSGAASDFEARATSQSGFVPTGTMGTWQGLGTTRTWSLSAAAGSDKSGTFLIEIRDVLTQTVLDQASITLLVSNS